MTKFENLQNWSRLKGCLTLAVVALVLFTFTPELQPYNQLVKRQFTSSFPIHGTWKEEAPTRSNGGLTG